MRRPKNLRRSSVASSAQCMSSKTTTSCCSRSRRLSISVKIVSRLAVDSIAANNAPCVCRAISCSGAKGRGVKRASHPPDRIRTSGCRAPNCCSRAVLPTPASPAMSAIQPLSSAAARRHVSKSARCCSRSISSIESMSAANSFAPLCNCARCSMQLAA
jgi:hypothetical protein